jgi:hypothetical protein
LFIALISGCAEDDFVVGVCPVVESTVQQFALSVPFNQIISVTFNEEINPSTINSSTLLFQTDGTVVSGAISYNGRTAGLLLTL